MVNYTLDDFSATTATSSPFSLGYTVFLELSERDEKGNNFWENRIGLLANDVNITTSKTIPSFPIPFSGIVMGESTTLALDLGMTNKSISITGVIHEQTLQKKFSDGVSRNMTLTAYEIAQLIHSYVDSSFRQVDQNLNKLFILYPGRVDNEWNNYSGVSDTTIIEKLPLSPFTWHNRAHDYANTLINVAPSKVDGAPFAAIYPDPFSNVSTDSVVGTVGFISNFQTTMSGAEHPSITFQLDFQEAQVVGS